MRTRESTLRKPCSRDSPLLPSALILQEGHITCLAEQVFGSKLFAFGLSNVLSRDFATWTAGDTVSRALDYRIGLMIISRP